MREFNKREKTIIKLISEIDVNKLPLAKEFLEEIFFTASNQKALIINHTTKDVLYYLNPNIFNNVNESRKNMFELFELLTLLSYLKENRYISIEIPSIPFSPFETIYSEFKLLPNAQIGNLVNLNISGDFLISNQPGEIRNINNQIILKGVLLNGYYDLINNILGPIFPNEELIDLVKNKFVAKDDRKHKQNLFVAWFGIGLALFLGILGIWNPFAKEDNAINIIKKLDSINNNNNNNNNTFKTSSSLKEINIELQKTCVLKKQDTIKSKATYKEHK